MRKESRLAWAFLVALLLFLGHVRATEPASVVSIGMTVSNLDRSIDFYTRVLGFTLQKESEVYGKSYEELTGIFGVRMRQAELVLGQEHVILSEFLVPKGRPVPQDSRSQDRWFQHIAIVVSDLDLAYAWLRENHVSHASTGPQRLPDWNPQAGGIRAFYFFDPDGHTLELIQFPAGKGDPRWQSTERRLFLGIDHTAIVVEETQRSLRFYRDQLGLRVAGESWNWGDEQEHLNNVPGARLHITTLRAPSGPGVELLEYLNPDDGRPYPDRPRPNDLFHWQTRLRVPSSEGAVALPDDRLGYSRASLRRDPDGHALLLTP